jgi:integrase
MRSKQRIPQVKLYIRRNSQPGQPYEPVNLKDIKFPKDGDAYCIHFYTHDGKRKWVTVGTDFKAAWTAVQDKQRELLSEAPATPATPKPSPDAPLTLEQLRGAFLTDRKSTFKKDGFPLDKDTIRSYDAVTREFLDTVNRKFGPEITKQDLKNWMKMLRDGSGQRGKPVSHRTVCNLYISIACFLHFCGVDHKRLLPQCERPTPEDAEPEAYSREEMEKFFVHATDERDNLYFEFLLKTGAREREGTYIEWTDMELGKEPHVLIRVKNGFRTKTGKSRRVELERGLADRLAAWKQSHPGSTYVFADEDGKIEGHFLRHCKDIAHRAGLNCGKCKPCVEKNECENYYLHKFRDTFCSWAAWDGVDPVTVQKQAGHASLDMTMRYFARKRNQQIHADMNRVFGTPVAVSATA